MDNDSKPKNKGGRPKVVIPWEMVARLASLHCTQEEIAFTIQISVDTLERACKRENQIGFAEYCRQKKEWGKASLRRAMWDLAVNGKDKTMLIWLSKQHLGFTDKIEQNNIQNINLEKTYVAEWGGKYETPDRDRETEDK